MNYGLRRELKKGITVNLESRRGKGRKGRKGRGSWRIFNLIFLVIDRYVYVGLKHQPQLKLI